MNLLHWLPAAKDIEVRLADVKRIVDPRARLAEIRTLAQLRLDFLQTTKLDRVLGPTLDALGGADGLQPFRMAWLASSTIDYVVPATRVAGLRRSLHIDSYVAPYGQIAQEILRPGSGLADFRPHAVFMAIDSEWAVPEIPITAGEQQVSDAIMQRIAELSMLWARLRDTHAAMVIQQTVPNLGVPLFGFHDIVVAASRTRVIDDFNAALVAAARAHGVRVLDLDGASAALGKDVWFDPVRWHQAKQLVSPAMTPLYGDWVARIAGALRGVSRKCLVLDLDNTLWGGVIGDDGVDGIVLGPGSAVGEAYVAFQRYAKALRQRGIVLAVATKNTQDLAEEPFVRHPEMVLRRSDIAIFRANWDDKAWNIREIARLLNLGLDALVFVDDNPAERDLVRRELPDVAVPELPEDPALYVRCLAAGGFFEADSFTADDLQRAEMYAAGARRADAASNATDLDAFLRSLDMRMEFARFDPPNLARIVQLINKTNQFNLTTTRYTEAEILALQARPDVVGLYFRLVDRFGDNGLISVVILVEKGRDVEIDTWLMSCRVLGRHVELAVLNIVAEEARARGAASLFGTYRPTAKNEMVKQHYERLGFTAVGENRWRLPLEDFNPRPVQIATSPAASV